jgi:hypothetical protein
MPDLLFVVTAADPAKFAAVVVARGGMALLTPYLPASFTFGPDATRLKPRGVDS